MTEKKVSKEKFTAIENQTEKIVEKQSDPSIQEDEECGEREENQTV